MAVAFVAAETTTDAVVGSAQSFTLTADIPSHSNGDLLVLFYTSSDNTNNPQPESTTPDGWTKQSTAEAGDFSAVRISCFTKTGDGAETTVDIVGPSNDHGACTVCCAYSGVDTGSPMDATPVTTETDSTADVTASSITTNSDNTEVIWSYCQDDDSATDADVDTDAGFNGTKRGFIAFGGGSGNGASMCVSSGPQGSAGASSTCVFSMNGDTEAACTITAALAAASVNTDILVPTGPWR